MRKTFFGILLVLFVSPVLCQHVNSTKSQLSLINIPQYDSLENLIASIKEDTAGVNMLGTASFYFAFYRPEKGVEYGQRGIRLAGKLGYKKGAAYCNQSLAFALWGIGNYGNALKAGLTCLHLYEELMDKEAVAVTYYTLANVYRDFGDYNRAIINTRIGMELFRQLGIKDIIGHAIIGSVYDLEGKMDSAKIYVQRSFELNRQINSESWGWLNYLQGNIFRKTRQYDSAMYYYRSALPLVEEKDIVETYNGIAKLYIETGNTDSAIFYATEVLEKWKSVAYQRGILEATNILAGAYKIVNRDSAIKYLEMSVALNDKLYNQVNERNIQNMAFDEQNRQDEIVRERQRLNNQLRLYLVLFSSIIFLTIAALLWRNNQQKQKAYVSLQQQKEQTEIQKSKAEQTLKELRSAQSQLIQSAKMASLGELTAGIAHEIQNPLNFVNNFSDVNIEIVDELQSELTRGNIGEAISISNEIKANSEKINHHGKRADAIVKGMLQHSPSSVGQKELTDINKLSEEYLRLSYQGFRAKYAAFSATLHTDFDASLEKINIVPQDIGRVLLNLYNNAFYAVHETKKLSDDSFEPSVAVSTKKESNNIIVSVTDNGNGIPHNIIDKIFQPFFTTKPTGQGTGLGLSLSYDIVKAHGGELKVHSKEGEGSKFIIQLDI